MDMTGKVVLVTGGGSGMGRLACQLMSRRGARVLALDVNEQGLAETAAGDAGIVTRLLDVTDFAAVDAALREAEATLGPVHRVYNAAAIMPLGKLLEQDNATVHRIMAINYGGLVNIAQAALPAMVRRGAGDFISFSSMAGIIPILMTGALQRLEVRGLGLHRGAPPREPRQRRALRLRLPAAGGHAAARAGLCDRDAEDHRVDAADRAARRARCHRVRAGEGRILGFPGQGHAHGLPDAPVLPEPHLERCAQEGRFLA